LGSTLAIVGLSGIKVRCGYCSGSRMHLSRAIVPAEKLRLFSRKNEDKKVTQIGLSPHIHTRKAVVLPTGL